MENLSKKVTGDEEDEKIKNKIRPVNMKYLRGV